MKFISAIDCRDAFRSLLRAPGVSGAAILCLALGLGVTTAISSAIDRALLQAPPFRRSDELVVVYRTTPHFNTGPFSAQNYRDLADRTRQLRALAAAGNATGLLSSGGEPTRITILQVSGNFFPMLGVAPQRGRLLMPADDADDQNKVAVLSDELWHERFGGDSSIVGRTILLDGNPVVIVGIAPREFRVPRGAQVLRAQLWTPLHFTPAQLGDRRSNYLMVMGRLASGATAGQAQAEMTGLFDKIVEQFPQLRGEGVRVLPMQAEAAATLRTPLLLLFGAVCIVLLIAATDVASLLLARGVRRRRELAIRSALGAGRWAVVRPVLLESLFLAVIGVIAGLGLAMIGVRTIGALAAERLPQLEGLSIDGRVVAFAVALALLVAIACGGIPAWRSMQVDPQEALRDGRGGGVGRGHRRALGALVVAEVALSLILLVGAGLVLKGFAKLIHNDPGFDPAPILTLEATVSPDRYPDGTTVDRFLEPALEAIRALPAVEAASAIQVLPYDNWGWNFTIRYEGQPGDNPTQRPLVEIRTVTPDFFAVTRQRLTRGRLLRPSDDSRPESPSVVVVNEALVKRDFPGDDPIGRRFYTSDTTFATIVGVVSDIRNVGPSAPPAAEAYWSYRQNGAGSTSFPIMIRVRGSDRTVAINSVRAAIHRIDAEAAITRVAPMSDIIARSVGRPRFYLTLLELFAGVAVILAVAGLYGVMNYAVAQRNRELGIRSALGSTPSRTVQLVAREGMRLVGVGVVLGLIGGAAVTRLLGSLLYGISPLDLPTWLAATALLAAVGGVATLVPALRATRVDPLRSIRAE